MDMTVRAVPTDDWPVLSVKVLEEDYELPVDVIYRLPFLDNPEQGDTFFFHQTSGDEEECMGWLYRLRDDKILGEAPISSLTFSINIVCSYAAHLHLTSFNLTELAHEIQRKQHGE